MSSMYDYIFEYFLWDYKDIAPIRKIHECLSRHQDWEMYRPSDGGLEIICTKPSSLHRAVVIHFAINANIEDFFEDDQLEEYQELFKQINIDPLKLSREDCEELCKTLPAYELFKE